MKEFIVKYSVQIFIGLLILAGGLIVWFSRSKPIDSTGIDGLARCLKKKGAKFYGTASCGYCNTQKKMFGDSVKLLPYIECSSPDNRQECQDAKITGYPTWVFADGRKQAGLMTIEQLRQYAGC